MIYFEGHPFNSQADVEAYIAAKARRSAGIRRETERLGSLQFGNDRTPNASTLSPADIVFLAWAEEEARRKCKPGFPDLFQSLLSGSLADISRARGGYIEREDVQPIRAEFMKDQQAWLAGYQGILKDLLGSFIRRYR